jgi:PhnB protein
VNEGQRAIDFYKKAFGAQELIRMEVPGGKIGHAELKIGDSIIMLADEFPGGIHSPRSLGGTSGGIFLYVTDVDAAFQQAVEVGAKIEMPLADMFWGDRCGRLTDPFGHSWLMATHIADVTPEEIKKRAQANLKVAQQQKRTAR